MKIYTGNRLPHDKVHTTHCWWLRETMAVLNHTNCKTETHKAPKDYHYFRVLQLKPASEVPLSWNGISSSKAFNKTFQLSPPKPPSFCTSNSTSCCKVKYQPSHHKINLNNWLKNCSKQFPTKSSQSPSHKRPAKYSFQTFYLNGLVQHCW